MGSQQRPLLEITNDSGRRYPVALLCKNLANNCLRTAFHISNTYNGIDANQLLQMREEMWRQFTMDENTAKSEIESHILSNKDMMMSSLWKLNVVDFEVTLLHVCEMVRDMIFIFVFLLLCVESLLKTLNCWSLGIVTLSILSGFINMHLGT